MFHDSPPPAYYQPPEGRPGTGELADEISWREAETYFKVNPGELVGRMFQWARKDERKAARNIITRWLRSQHPELRRAGQVALESWVECFCNEPAYARAYADWKRWYAAQKLRMEL